MLPVLSGRRIVLLRRHGRYGRRQLRVTGGPEIHVPVSSLVPQTAAETVALRKRFHHVGDPIGRQPRRREIALNSARATTAHGKHMPLPSSDRTTLHQDMIRSRFGLSLLRGQV